MKVYIVMGNDYPARVYERSEDAKAYCREKMNAPENKYDLTSSTRRIYYRTYEFDLIKERPVDASK